MSAGDTLWHQQSLYSLYTFLYLLNHVNEYIPYSKMHKIKISSTNHTRHLTGIQEDYEEHLVISTSGVFLHSPSPSLRGAGQHWSHLCLCHGPGEGSPLTADVPRPFPSSAGNIFYLKIPFILNPPILSHSLSHTHTFTHSLTHAQTCTHPPSPTVFVFPKVLPCL